MSNLTSTQQKAALAATIAAIGGGAAYLYQKYQQQDQQLIPQDQQLIEEQIRQELKTYGNPILILTNQDETPWQPILKFTDGTLLEIPNALDKNESLLLMIGQQELPLKKIGHVHILTILNKHQKPISLGRWNSTNYSGRIGLFDNNEKDPTAIKVNNRQYLEHIYLKNEGELKNELLNYGIRTA